MVFVALHRETENVTHFSHRISNRIFLFFFIFQIKLLMMRTSGVCVCVCAYASVDGVEIHANVTL